MSLFQHSPIYQSIKTKIENNFNQRLDRDYNQLLERLSTKIQPDVLQQLPLVRPIHLRLISKPPTRLKFKTRYDQRCRALYQSGHRCHLPIINKSFCHRHQKQIPKFSLNSIDQAFYPIRTDPRAPDQISSQTNQNYQMLSLKSQRGRKYYQIPNDLNKDYLPVRPIEIDGQFYLQDQRGYIYDYSETVLIVGRQMDNLIKWYRVSE